MAVKIVAKQAKPLHRGFLYEYFFLKKAWFRTNKLIKKGASPILIFNLILIIFNFVVRASCSLIEASNTRNLLLISILQFILIIFNFVMRVSYTLLKISNHKNVLDYKKKLFFKITLITIIIIFGYSPLAIAQSQSQITLLAGGDVEWSRMWSESIFHQEIIEYNLDFKSKQEEARYPFQKIKPLLENADITFVNLETPLSDTAKRHGGFLTPTAFASGLKWAGIDIVSTANNHALDAGVAGLKDTLTSLSQVNLPAVGSGKNLASARLPFIFEKNGIRLGFLAYTMSENSGNSSYVKRNRAGVMPTDLSLIKDKIT